GESQLKEGACAQAHKRGVRANGPRPPTRNACGRGRSAPPLVLIFRFSGDPRSTALDLTAGGGEDLTRVERTQPIGGEEHVRRRDLVRFAGPTHWGLSTEALAATFPQGGRDQRCPDRPRRHTVDTDVAVPQHLRQGEPQ